MNRLNILPLIALALFSFACKKDKYTRSEKVTVILISEVTIDDKKTWMAIVENADPKVYSFLCDFGTEPRPVYRNTCGDRIFITNLPENMREYGKRLSFTRWIDHGENNAFEDTNGPHDLEVKDPREEQ